MKSRNCGGSAANEGAGGDGVCRPLERGNRDDANMWERGYCYYATSTRCLFRGRLR